MAMRKNTRLWGLFFCAVGSVCSGPAIGADEVTSDAMPAGESAILDAGSDSGNLPQGQQVNVGSFGQIDLHVKDLDLTKVLQLLSIQSEKNIIASRSVSGTVSADLYGVDFYAALDAILHTNGFGYQEKGNFIYVYTAEELKALEQANRKTATRILRLNYLTAADASAFVSPLLSSAGSISISGDVPAGMQPSLADGGANSFAMADTLIIRDYPENIEEIETVLEELDVRPKQVLVEATVLQARLTEANAFGVDFALFGDLGVTDFTSPLGAVDDLIAGGGPGGSFDSGNALVSSPGDTGVGPATLKLGFMGNDAAVFIKALDSVTDTTVLATPKLLVLNRQRADLLVGERLGYLSSTATDTSTTQTVEFLDVGTQLTVRPYVSNDGFVRLELRPSVSDGNTNLVGGFVIPDETTQELTTNVIVRSGQTVVLGGLFKEDTTIGRKQVPGLGSVPIVGNAFKGHNDNVDRSEVIFLIKPTVMKDQSLYAAGESAQDSIRLAQIGAREGLLPWSRSKLTSSHLKQAYEHLNNGERDKALWDVNLALHLNPSMVDALRLKEQITGERLYMGDRSILNDAVDAAITEQLELEAAEAADAAEATEAVEEAQDTQVEQGVTEDAGEEAAEEAVEAENAVEEVTDAQPAQAEEVTVSETAGEQEMLEAAIDTEATDAVVEQSAQMDSQEVQQEEPAVASDEVIAEAAEAAAAAFDADVQDEAAADDEAVAVEADDADMAVEEVMTAVEVDEVK